MTRQMDNDLEECKKAAQELVDFIDEGMTLLREELQKNHFDCASRAAFHIAHLAATLNESYVGMHISQQLLVRQQAQEN